MNDDPGLHDLLFKPNAQLIIPPQYRPFLNFAVVGVDPLQNIRAGVGYLLYRMAHFNLVDVPAPEWDPMPGSRHPEKPSNAYAPLPVLPRTRKALGIIGWWPFSLKTIALRYNGGGDGNYYGNWSTHTISS